MMVNIAMTIIAIMSAIDWMICSQYISGVSGFFVVTCISDRSGSGICDSVGVDSISGGIMTLGLNLRQKFPMHHSFVGATKMKRKMTTTNFMILSLETTKLATVPIVSLRGKSVTVIFVMI